MTILLDANVVIDLLTNSEWADWVTERLAELDEDEEFVINQLIYAEVSYSFNSEDELNEILTRLAIGRSNLPWKAAFPAARAFRAHRERGGVKTAPLPDFYIGAHALVDGLTLLTRDGTRFRTYFPEIQLISPP